MSTINDNSSCVFFLLDRSASMDGSKLDELKQAAKNFFKDHLKKIAKRNQIYVGIISFDTTPRLDFPLSDVSNPATEPGFQYAVNALVANGDTAVWDATGDAIDQFYNDSKINPNNQYIIFLVTDGEDNQSKRFPTGSAGLQPLIDYAKAKNIELIIYGVSIGAPNKDLEILASNFNGKVFTVKDIGQEFSKTMDNVGKIIQRKVNQIEPDLDDDDDVEMIKKMKKKTTRAIVQRPPQIAAANPNNETQKETKKQEDPIDEENSNKEFYWRNYSAVRNKRCNIDFFMKGKRCEDMNLTGESVLQYLSKQGFALIAGTKDTEITFADDFSSRMWNRYAEEDPPCRTSHIIALLLDNLRMWRSFQELGFGNRDLNHEFSCGSNPFSIFWNDVKFGKYSRYEFPGIYIKRFEPGMDKKIYDANVLFVKRIHAIEAALYYSISSRLVAKYFTERPRSNPNEERVAIMILAAMFTFLSFDEKEFTEVLTYSDIVGPSGFVLNYIRAFVRLKKKTFREIQEMLSGIVQSIPWELFIDPTNSFAEAMMRKLKWESF